MNGTIALICNKYVVLNQMMKINRNSLYDMLLPGDNVEYNIIDNMINIIKITSRKTQYLLAIVKKIENNQAILFCPNYPKFFEPKIMNNNYKLNNMMIIEITLDNINVIIIYDSIKNRIHDKDIILMLYKLNATTDIKLEYNINNNNNVTSNNIIDLSHLDSFNVDPTNSKDFDDAISINENKIYVHIVDGNHMIVRWIIPSELSNLG
jgi:exoribonuclease R